MGVNLATDVKGNKKDFYKYMDDKRKTTEDASLLLNEMEDLVTQDKERVEALNTSFISACTITVNLQESQVPERKKWAKTYPEWKRIR